MSSGIKTVASSGPSTKPRAIDAPSLPSTVERSSGRARSAANAWALGSAEAESTPPTTRPAIKVGNVSASPMSRNETAKPNSPNTITGLRPTRSARAPQPGALTSWATA